MIDLLNAFFEDYTGLKLILVMFVSSVVFTYITLLPFRVAKAVRERNKRRAQTRSLEGSIAALVAELPTLRRRLLEIARDAEGDALSAIVAFFNTTSPWHDRGLYQVVRDMKDLNSPRHASMINPLTELVLQISMTGRVEFGWNRTAPGELVTEDNVYLGDIWGLWTKTVRFWKTRRDDKKGTHGWAAPGNYFASRNCYDLVSDQARGFIGDHIPVMVELIDRLTHETATIRLVA